MLITIFESCFFSSKIDFPVLVEIEKHILLVVLTYCVKIILNLT